MEGYADLGTVSFSKMETIPKVIIHAMSELDGRACQRREVQERYDRCEEDKKGRQNHFHVKGFANVWIGKTRMLCLNINSYEHVCKLQPLLLSMLSELTVGESVMTGSGETRKTNNSRREDITFTQLCQHGATYPGFCHHHINIPTMVTSPWR